ncbi:hypothetical protein FHS91_003437 [Sphingobium xanthum]|uniref:hypothetical protein n=1 Tax=Sphingobium xanthum TaxID=1387165 RepID=UPI001C8C9E36|nr:hypothetical protein [Sphingobium xanthum]
MTVNKVNSPQILVDQQIDAAQNFTEDGKHIEALEIYEKLFADGPRTQALYDGAARSATAALLDGTFNEDWRRARRDALFRHLILQAERFDAPPAFAFQIARSHSSGGKDVYARTAAELKPVLTALRDEGLRDRSFLLMVLLLRAPLHDWMDQAALTRWHLDLLPDFDVGDMAIPYNVMFERLSAARNVADIASMIANTQPDALARRFPPWKLLRFHWITGSSRLEAVMPELLAEWRAGKSTSDEDLAALRSLALRLFVTQKLSGSPGDGLDQFVAEWTPMHPPRTRASAAESARAKLVSRHWQAIHAGFDLVRRRAPFLKVGKRRPRVALCVSGQLRGYMRAFPTWRESLLRDIDYEVVVHSWEKVGRSGAEPYRAYLPFAGGTFSEAYRAQAHRAGMPEMHKRYPALFAALQQGGIVTAGELGAFYGTDHVVLEDDAGPAFQGWSNSRKMHYKVAAAAGLLDRLAGEHDLVLRVRPDKQLGLIAFSWGDMLKATSAAPVIYADGAMGQQYGSLLIGDQVALGEPKAMAVYADTLNLVPRLATQHLTGCKPEFEGHVSLAQTCWHAGIEVHRLPVKIGRLMEAEPMSAPDIAAALEQDAAGRMDGMDQALLAAIRTDLGAGN